MQFQAGNVILRKGDEGHVVFFIKEGSVDCTDIGNGNKEVVTLQEGDYFGERALLRNEPRVANVTARTNVTRKHPILFWPPRGLRFVLVMLIYGPLRQCTRLIESRSRIFSDR